MGRQSNLVDVAEAGRLLGVSVSTVWRMIRRGQLASIRRNGRRLIRKESLTRTTFDRQRERLPVFHPEHPIFRLVGAGRSGGLRPGARDKHAILDE